MKRQNNFNAILRVFSVFLIAITFTVIEPVAAQSSLLYSIDKENYFYKYAADGAYKELYISISTQADYLYLDVKGGDGGYNLNHNGGVGAVTKGLFEIGTGSGQIPPGSKLRVIPGQRGRSHFGDSGTSGRGSAGGGGGGSAVVLLPAGKTNWDTESIVMMVAGGGGGGGSKNAGRSGNAAVTGSGGKDPAGNDLHNGGSKNYPGSATSDASGGAGMDHAANLGGASCNSGYDNPLGARRGWPTGGAGCPCLCYGGFGFGGGGSGNQAGGGGGGYSGGGGGGNDYRGGGGGGGGGSYVTSSLNISQKSIVGSGTTRSPSDGYVIYGLLEAKTIKFAFNTGKCIDDYGSATANGNNILRYTCTGNPNQKWFFNTEDRTIRTKLTMDKCLSLKDDTGNNGTNIHLWDCKVNDNQRFIYNGLYKTIHSARNANKCIDAANGSAYPNADVNVQLWDCNYSNNNQKWNIEGATAVSNVSNMKHIVPVLATSFAVHSHTGAESGSNIQLWTKDNTNTAEQWYFDGLAIKMRDHQNLCIDLKSSNTSNGNNIQLYNCNSTNAQKWLYDGMTQTIHSVINQGKCMQIVKNTDGVYGKRSNVEIHDCNGSKEQMFTIQE